MIFFWGSGRGGFPVGILLVVGVFLLLALGDGSGLLLLPLLVMGLFFLVPVLLVRSVLRGAGRVLQPPQQPQWEPNVQRPRPVPSGAPPVHRADVESLRDRLAHDVRSLQPGDDPVLRQAMADAGERHATCTALLERARSDDQLRTAWVAAAEGLHATRLVRERLGLHAPAVPLLPDAGPHLEQHARVRVGGREHVGAPSYEPGRQHWFPGGPVEGRYVPGGWYATPFWPGSLVLGVLGGFALGGLAAGAAGAWGSGDDWSGGAGGGGWGDGSAGGWADGAGGGGWGGDGGGGGWDGRGGFGGDFGGDW